MEKPLPSPESPAFSLQDAIDLLNVMADEAAAKAERSYAPYSGEPLAVLGMAKRMHGYYMGKHRVLRAVADRVKGL